MTDEIRTYAQSPFAFKSKSYALEWGKERREGR